MNCRTSQFELSQCLDGRLASGRRSAVMDHVESCDACAHFWGELQRAQNLVLRMPRQRVSGDFHERLFERIQSGEGTPEAVFHEPVPMATKVRYVLTGAAAAAAVLVAVGLLRGRHDGVSEPEQISRAATGVGNGSSVAGSSVASSVADVHATPANADRIDTSVDMAGPRAQLWSGMQAVSPATPGMVATEAARHFQSSFESTNDYARNFAARPSPGIAHNLCNNALELKQYGSLLIDLRDRDHLNFSDRKIDADLHDLVASLDGEALRQQHYDAVARQVVLPVLQRVGSLRRLQHSLFIRPEPSPLEQTQLVWRIYEEQRDTLTRMFVILPGADLDSLRWPAPGRLYSIAGECGPLLLLAPRH